MDVNISFIKVGVYLDVKYVWWDESEATFEPKMNIYLWFISTLFSTMDKVVLEIVTYLRNKTPTTEQIGSIHIPNFMATLAHKYLRDLLVRRFQTCLKKYLQIRGSKPSNCFIARPSSPCKYSGFCSPQVNIFTTNWIVDCTDEMT